METASVLRKADRTSIVTLLLFDDRGRRVAGNPATAQDPLTMTVSLLGGLHALSFPIHGGTVRLVPNPRHIAHLLAGLLIIDLACGALALFFTRRAGRGMMARSLEPLVSTTAALERLAGGDLTERPVAAYRRNEVGQLAVAYNRAAASLAGAFAQRDHAYAEMRRFVADAGHELRTPLTVILGYLDALRDDVVTEPSARRAVLATMTVEGARLRNLVNGLIRLARLDAHPPRTPESLSLREVANGVRDGLPQAWRHRVRDDGGEAYAKIDREDCVAVVRNLIDNAARYTAGGVFVEIGHEDGVARLAVRDEGPGMSAEESEHAFDRFYRARREPSEEGSGLGLSIVKRAVESASGNVKIESSPARGTVAIVELPKG